MGFDMFSSNQKLRKNPTKTHFVWGIIIVIITIISFLHLMPENLVGLSIFFKRFFQKSNL